VPIQAIKRQTNKPMQNRVEFENRPKIVPPPGSGQRIYEIDLLFNSYCAHPDYRFAQYNKTRELIDKYEGVSNCMACAFSFLMNLKNYFPNN
jgi:hypothetical protein